MLTIFSTSSSSRMGQLEDTSIATTSMEMRAAGSKMSLGRTGMGLVWHRGEEEKVSDLGEKPNNSKEDIALEIPICEGGGEDDRPREHGKAGDAGSDPLNDPDTLSTVTCMPEATSSS